MTVKQPVYTPSQGIRGSDPIINAAEDLMSLAKAPSMDSAMQAADSALDAAISIVGSMTSPHSGGLLVCCSPCPRVRVPAEHVDEPAHR